MTSNGVKLFVTGSDGFIGSELISQCKEKGIEVVGADIRGGFDVCSKDIASAIPEEVDAVVHLAGLSDDNMCKNNAYAAFDLNVLGTLNMMEAAMARKAKQFIFASTEWVYDNCTAEEVKTEESVVNIANHTSEYALSKLVSEANLRQKYNQGFCPVTILRFGIV
ncbi:MAG: SDR family oxidoreductase, partial [Candidatus Jorgensenbacteria bacterium]